MMAVKKAMIVTARELTAVVKAPSKKTDTLVELPDQHQQLVSSGVNAGGTGDGCIVEFVNGNEGGFSSATPYILCFAYEEEY